MELSDFQNLMDRLAHQCDEGEDVPSADREREIREALAKHPEWEDEMRSREHFDVQLRETLGELEVPFDSKDRLLSLLEETALEQTAKPDIDDNSTTLNTPPATTHLPPSRRRAVALFAAACLMFLVSVGVFLSTLSPVLTMAEVQQQMPLMWDRPTEQLVAADVDMTTSATLPSGDWENPRIHYQTDWSLTQINSDSDQFVEFRKFSFQSSRGVVHHGLLVSLPSAKLSQEERPSASSPFSADIRYLSTPAGLTLAIVAWHNTQTDSVYFLAVPAESRTLDALDALLYVNPA